MLNPSKELKKLVQALESAKKYPFQLKSEEEENSLRKLARDCDFAFYSVVGSWNYGLASEHSDVDCKITYFPSFGHFYTGKFPKLSVVDKNVDFTIQPIHQFMEHVLKGNINFFEVLYPSNPAFLETRYPEEIDPIFDIAREMIPINPIPMICAVRSTADSKISSLDKYSIDNEYMKEQFGYNLKEAANAVRQLYFLITYLETGEIQLSNHHGLDMVKEIRDGKWARAAAMGIYHDAYRDLDQMVYGYPWPDEYKYSARVEELKDSEKWSKLKEELESLVQQASLGHIHPEYHQYLP